MKKLIRTNVRRNCCYSSLFFIFAMPIGFTKNHHFFQGSTVIEGAFRTLSNDRAFL